MTKYRVYADNAVVHEDDFSEYDSSIPYYDDYSEHAVAENDEDEECWDIPEVLKAHIASNRDSSRDSDGVIRHF